MRFSYNIFQQSRLSSQKPNSRQASYVPIASQINLQNYNTKSKLEYISFQHEEKTERSRSVNLLESLPACTHKQMIINSTKEEFFKNKKKLKKDKFLTKIPETDQANPAWKTISRIQKSRKNDLTMSQPINYNSMPIRPTSNSIRVEDSQINYHHWLSASPERIVLEKK
ncbi:Hypothetical_protein [Hexamita inflata]|uniref:Hypothetical_protein n=1 Tax=Hexamita inflata TaxID=28002 RepID=A0ABP1HIN7_9EUKA